MRWKRPAYTGDETLRTTKEALAFQFSDYEAEQLREVLVELINRLFENEMLRKIDVKALLGPGFERAE